MPRYLSPPDKIAYNIQVWELARQIPHGKVATYGQIASLIPPPTGVEPATYKAFAPRWVGSAMATCPDDVPWHRVINSQGKISLRKGGGHETQRQRLENEGIIFDARHRVDLSVFGWESPSNSAASTWKQKSFEDLI